MQIRGIINYNFINYKRADCIPEPLKQHEQQYIKLGITPYVNDELIKRQQGEADRDRTHSYFVSRIEHMFFLA